MSSRTGRQGPAGERGQLVTTAIVERLASKRASLGLSQAAVAKLMGTAQSAISEIETGVTVPTLPTVARYADVVGLEVALRETGTVWCSAPVHTPVREAAAVTGTFRGPTAGTRVRRIPYCQPCAEALSSVGVLTDVRSLSEVV